MPLGVNASNSRTDVSPSLFTLAEANKQEETPAVSWGGEMA